MDMELSEVHAILNEIGVLRRVVPEGSGNLCVCCGTSVGYFSDKEVAPQKHLITATIWKGNVLPSITEGCEGFLIPDAEQSLFLEWYDL